MLQARRSQQLKTAAAQLAEARDVAKANEAAQARLEALEARFEAVQDELQLAQIAVQTANLQTRGTTGRVATDAFATGRSLACTSRGPPPQASASRHGPV